MSLVNYVGAGTMLNPMRRVSPRELCSMQTLFYDIIEGKPDASFTITQTQHRLVCKQCKQQNALQTQESDPLFNKPLQCATACSNKMQWHERKVLQMYDEILSLFPGSIPPLVHHHMMHCVGALELTCTMYGQGNCLLCTMQRFMMRVFTAMEDVVFANGVSENSMRASVCAAATVLFRLFMFAELDTDESALDFTDMLPDAISKTDQEKMHSLCVKAACCYCLVAKDRLGFCDTRCSVLAITSCCPCDVCAMAVLHRRDHRLLLQQLSSMELEIFLATVQDDPSRRGIVFPTCTFVDALESYKDWRHAHICIPWHGGVMCQCEEVICYARRFALQAVMDWDSYCLNFIKEVHTFKTVLATRELRAQHNQFVSFDPIAVASQSMKKGAALLQFERIKLMLAMGTHHRVGAKSSLRNFSADCFDQIVRALSENDFAPVGVTSCNANWREQHVIQNNMDALSAMYARSTEDSFAP